MKYAIIGSGAIGSALAAQFARVRLEVAVATAKGPAAVAPLRERLGPQIIPTEVGDALLADFVALAVPFESVRGLVEQVSDWNRRIIIDATNAIDYSDFSPADLDGRESSDIVAEWANNARVVKAFGNTWAKVLARDPSNGDGGRSRRIGRTVRIRTDRLGPKRCRWQAAFLRRSIDRTQLYLPAHHR
jgi:predicted dinucleotide-binding enzyme